MRFAPLVARAADAVFVLDFENPRRVFSLRDAIAETRVRLAHARENASISG
jgi:hypothetical protein